MYKELFQISKSLPQIKRQDSYWDEIEKGWNDMSKGQ